MTSSEISDPSEIEEVDQFGSDLEFAQHDGMQRWSYPSLLCSPSGSHTGERAREREAHEEERRVPTHGFVSLLL
jgi:hypothetical protein